MIVTRQFLFLFALLLNLFFSSALWSSEQIKVGVYNNDPLVFIEETGKPSGLFIDVLEHVAKTQKWQLKYVQGSWQQNLSRLANNEIDILCVVAPSPERRTVFDFTKEDILTNWGQLYVSEESEITTIADLAGKKVAVLKGDAYRKAFVELIAKFGVSCRLIEVDDYHDVLSLVATGEADAGVVNRIFGTKFVAQHNIKKSGIIFNPVKVRYASPKGKYNSILKTLDNHIATLKNDENSVYFQSLDRWLTISPHQSTTILPKWIQWVIPITLATLSFLFLANMMLRSRVAARTKELTVELIRRKKTEKALEQAYAIINKSPAVAFLWKNEKGWPVEFVSDNVAELCGYSAEDFTSTGLLYREIIHPEDLKRAAKDVDLFEENGGRIEKPLHQYRIIAKDKTIHWVDDRTFLRKNDKGHVTHFEGIVLDITENVEAEEALRRSKAKLARSKKIESLGLLAGGVAHDLNNVLAGIVSYPDLLLMELPANSPLKSTIRTIKDSGDRAVAIVQDLLTMARCVASPKEVLSLNDQIADYLDSAELEKLKTIHPEVTITTALSSDLFNIIGSRVHIRKVIMNLVLNGSEAIRNAGSVVIATENRSIDTPVRGYNDIVPGRYAVISVTDSGSGISNEELEQIFEPFYTKKTMGRSGTGLGLAVVWNVVQDHDGYIDVISDMNGTRFELFFPTTSAPTITQESTQPRDAFRGNGEVILIVDDVSSQRNICSKMLESLGYKTVAVGSGDEAIAYLKEQSVDLVLLDMIMTPGIGGKETYEQIITIHPGQKAIICSGYAQTEDVNTCLELGAGRFIKKPLTMEILGREVSAELKRTS